MIRKIRKRLLFLVICNMVTLFYIISLTRNTTYTPNEETKISTTPIHPTNQFVSQGLIAVLVITCDRKPYLNRTLKSLFRHHPDPENPSLSRFPIYLSNGCPETDIDSVFNLFKSRLSGYFKYLPNTDSIFRKLESEVPDSMMLEQSMLLGYSKVADHYNGALNWLFQKNMEKYSVLDSKMTHIFNPSALKAVIIVEDDIEVSPDFFQYFNSTYPILETDKTLYCVSAWNDNGRANLTDSKGADRMFRTDFFPGLGWMMLRSLWDELEPQWPIIFWDDFLRSPFIRKERQCIRPEISRTSNFGQIGVSASQFYTDYIQAVKTNRQIVDFSKLDLSYLLHDEYQINFIYQLNHSKEFPFANVPVISKYKNLPSSIKIPYKSESEFKTIAFQFGLFPELRFGMPRTSYLGIIYFMYNNKNIYIYPAKFNNTIK